MRCGRSHWLWRCQSGPHTADVKMLAIYVGLSAAEVRKLSFEAALEAPLEPKTGLPIEPSGAA